MLVKDAPKVEGAVYCSVNLERLWESFRRKDASLDGWPILSALCYRVGKSVDVGFLELEVSGPGC